MADTLPASNDDTIGIVTVLYNSDDVIEDFFISLSRQTGVSFKLYVVDNSPSPQTLERCRVLAAQYGIQAELVFNNANLGVAKGNNQGIELALRDGCRWVLLANNDTEFSPTTMSILLRAAKAGEIAVTPKILYYDPANLIWYAGGRIDAWRMRVPHLGMGQVDNGQYDSACYTPYAPTCFMLLDSSIFEQVGLMDESYFVYYDDADFVWRMRRHGMRIRYVPAALVQHKVSTSTGGERSPFSLYYTNRNRLYFIRKNLDGVQRAYAVSYFLLTRIVNSVRMPRTLAKRLWAGVRDGLRLQVARDAH